MQSSTVVAATMAETNHIVMASAIHSWAITSLLSRGEDAAGIGSSVTRNSERRQERLDARSDLVSDRTDRLSCAALRIVEFPVFVALAGIERARVPASHSDHHIDGTDDLVGPGLRELCADVDPDLLHCLYDSDVDLRGRLGTSRVDDDTVAGKLTHPSGCHLGAPRVVDAEEEDGRTADGNEPSTFPSA